MLVRIVYAVVASFQSTPENPGSETWVYFALLMVLDFVATAIYTLFGLTVLKPARRAALEARYKTDLAAQRTDAEQRGMEMVPSKDEVSETNQYQPSHTYLSSNAYRPNLYRQNGYGQTSN